MKFIWDIGSQNGNVVWFAQNFTKIPNWTKSKLIQNFQFCKVVTMLIDKLLRGFDSLNILLELSKFNLENGSVLCSQSHGEHPIYNSFSRSS